VGLSAQALSETSISTSWTRVLGVTYRLNYNTTIVEVGDKSNYVLENLGHGRNYVIKVAAVNSFAPSAYSTSVS